MMVCRRIRQFLCLALVLVGVSAEADRCDPVPEVFATMPKNIIEIWNSKIIKQSRSILSKEKRSFRPCINCDVKGDIMGHANFIALQKYYGK